MASGTSRCCAQKRSSCSAPGSDAAAAARQAAGSHPAATEPASSRFGAATIARSAYSVPVTTSFNVIVL